MTSATSFNSSKAIRIKPPPSVADAQSILNKQTTLEELYNYLARQALTPDSNSGKQRFFAVVTRVIDDASALTDLFLSDRHEIERINGLSDSESKSYKIALLHVPELHTYFNSFDEEQFKTSFKPNQGLTSSDLQKIPALTTKKVKRGQIVQVIFQNTATYTGPIIIDVDKTKNQRLQGEKKKYESTKEVMENILACKLLALEDAEGYGVASNLSYNLKNPKDYLYAYSTLLTLLNSANLIQQVILTNTTGELQQKYGGFVDDQTTSGYQKYFLENQDDFPFTNIKIYGSQKLVDFIKKEVAVEVANSYTPVIETNQSVTDPRAFFIDLKGLKNNNLIGDISVYLKELSESHFRYKWSSEPNNVYKMDIFGKDNLSTKLKNSTIDDAIKYSSFVVNKSFSSTESNERTSISPPSEKQAAQSAQDLQKQRLTGNVSSKISSELPNCEDQTEVNNLLYNLVKEGKSLKTLKKDNIRLKKITKNKGLDGWLSNIETYIMDDFERSTNLPKSKEFNYNLSTEVIAVQPENPKTRDALNAKKTIGLKKDKNKQKKKKLDGRGTNKQKIKQNGKKLAEFVRGLTFFIAQNEGLTPDQVVVFPISVFRKYTKSRRNSGIDRNSRHFFNRAIDLCVYINIDNKFLSSSKKIPTNSTYEIPNTIVYLYILKYLDTIGKGKLSTCGLALLEKGKSRQVGYVHYEYMNDLVDPRDPNIQPLRRRWLSESNDSKTVYGQAFGRADAIKDKIIKSFVIKDTKSKTGALPPKIENLL